MDIISKYLIIERPNSSKKLLYSSENELIKSLQKMTTLIFQEDSIVIDDGKRVKYGLKHIQKESGKSDDDSENLSRFYVLTLTFDSDDDIEQFELIDKEMNNFIESFNNMSMLILEDVISQYYSKKAYELIHIIENKTRSLIAEVMYLKSDNMDWEKALTKSLGIRDTGKGEKPLDGKYFSDLTKLLFTIYEDDTRDGYDPRELFVGGIKNLAQLTNNGNLAEVDPEELKNYVKQVQEYAPKSVWDRYIVDYLEGGVTLSNNLKNILELLSSSKGPRNRIAHNKFFRRKDYESLKSNVEKLLESISKAVDSFESNVVTSYSNEDSNDIKSIFIATQESSLDKKEISTSFLEDLTIVVPARQEGFKQVFLGEQQWYDIRISEDNRDMIKFIAAYETAPVSGIQYIAEIDDIVPSDNYVGYWKIKFKKDTLKQYEEKKEFETGFPPRNIVYTSKKLLDQTDNLDNVLSVKKFYAVAKGKVPGIYTTWLETEKQVTGFSGAVYKSFTSYIEAYKFLHYGVE
jgi:caulimovirus viroplasmin